MSIYPTSALPGMQQVASGFRPRIAFIGGIYHETAAALLAQTMDVVPLHTPSPEEIRIALRDCHLAIVRYPYKLDGPVLQDARQLIAVASSGRGTDSIDVPSCTKHGVAVINNPGFGTRPVSEHALALMLALARKLFRGDKAVRAGGAWDKRTELDVLDLHGRTLGIVGLGLIGMEMARKCLGAIGKRVLAYDPHDAPAAAQAAGVELLPELADVLRQADFVSIHCELNAETRGIMNETTLRQMQPHAYLVNTARGKVVQQAALVRALQERWIAGAALDVYEDEPMAEDSPLLQLPELMLSPHVAGLSGDALHDLANSAAHQLSQAIQGQRPANVVNSSAWDAAMQRLQRLRQAQAT